MVALGVGLALGGAVIYGLVTSETARLLALGMGMFIVGSLMMALFLTYAVKAIAGSFAAGRQDTTYNMLPPGQRGLGASDWMIEGPRAEHLLPRLPAAVEDVGEGDEFVA